MMVRPIVIPVLAWALLGPGARGLAAQTVPGLDLSWSQKIERVGKDHWRFVGAAEIEHGNMKFYAEEIEFFNDTHRLVATGNVLFTEGTNRISADRAEFDTQTRLGTFFNASGTTALGERADRAMFGSLEPEVYFFGETIEKVGPKTFKITQGGFTTCVQPTPRWQMTSGSVVLRLEHHALVKNLVLKVKDVPLFYLPIIYYPMNKEDRATGFLLPTYGTSTYQGTRLSNAFFWAVNRSHDVTFLHDWFSSTGQGFGGEYRYVLGPGSEGNARLYTLNQRAITTTATTSTGTTTTTTPGLRSYQVQGGVNQVVAPGVRARGRIDYFSSVQVQQFYSVNIVDTSRRQRAFSGNVAGAWGVWSLSGTVDRTEYLFGTTSSTLTGGAPRISGGRAERPLVNGLPFYGSFSGEYVKLLRESRTATTKTNTGLSRVDVAPLLRIPFTKWQFLTINSSIGWRDTYWTASYDKVTGARTEEPISRRFFDLQSRIVGPVLNRIWNLESSGYAEKIKHTIEPFLTVRRTTAIDQFAQIVQLESVDSIVGTVTQLSYGVNNRIYAKRRGGGPQGVPAREIVNVALAQSYYTDARAALYDRQYGTSFSATKPYHFSPATLAVRASPTDTINATLRAEYDTQFKAFRTISANGTVARGEWLFTTVGWSQTRYIEGLSGFNDKTRLTHSLNSATSWRLLDNRVGGAYSFNLDVAHRNFLQQRLVGYYNTQCCGFALEYQRLNYITSWTSVAGFQDRRFNFSFTLAGLSTFSNFFGALGGTSP